MSKKIVIMGATGNTGSKLAHHLLAAGHSVIALGRNAERLESLVAAGATPSVGDQTDAAFLQAQFDQADVAYILIAPNVTAPDFRAYQHHAADQLVAALQASSLRHVVMLSSHGADTPHLKIGPIKGLSYLEEKLSHIEGLNAAILRPTYFMENTLGNLAQLQQGDTVYGSMPGDLAHPMIATADIAAKASEVIEAGFSGHSVHTLLGPRDYTQAEAAAILGQAMGKTANYVQVPQEAASQAMKQFGFGDSIIADYAEMTQGITEDNIFHLIERKPENTTPTTYEAFVQQVLAAHAG